MVSTTDLRLSNLGGVADGLEQFRSFFEGARGARVMGDAEASGVRYLRASLGAIDVNLFVQPVFTTDAVEPGWSHVSFETDHLQSFLDDPTWSRTLAREPWTITTLGESRRIAFFEPFAGLRIEIMQIDMQLPSVDEVPGASTIYEARGRAGDAHGLVHRAGPSACIGRALTVECHPGDNLAVHRAVARAAPGDVLVVAGRDVPVGYLGDVLVHAARLAGIAGVLVDGGVRDLNELQGIDLPVFSTRVAMAGASKVSPGAIGRPVVFAGASVSSGDVVRTDSDGAVFVPRGEWKATLAAAADRDAFEDAVIERLNQGETTLSIFGLEA
ncbi:RraA family protein [Leucobacter chromiiresistens]|nr:hypothetical protein [Leucobacter chromiiresistens]